MTNSSNRITVVCSSPNGRGIDRYSQHLARALDAQLVRPEWRGFYVVWEVVGILLYLSILRVIFTTMLVVGIMADRLSFTVRMAQKYFRTIVETIIDIANSLPKCIETSKPGIYILRF